MKFALNKKHFFQILPKVNLALFFSAAILAVYLIFGMMRYCRYFSFSGKDFETESFEPESKGTKYADAENSAFDEKVFEQRFLFNFSGEEKVQKQDLTFQLLGVISVGEKYMAVIKNTGKNKEYRCIEGEAIGELFTVKKIFKDKVILEFEDKIMELVL